MSKSLLKNNTAKTPEKKTVIEPNDDSGSTFRMVREGIETLAIALVLAFLFKTFEAEAYVIPTGSMAPTLMGNHKDVHCPQCDFRFQVSASDEVDEGNRGLTSRRKKDKLPPPEVVGGTCPQCRYTMYFGKDNEEKKTYPTFDGDRILVFKYFYDYFEPKRWQVTVFRFPGGPQTNYIKRLIGLENETIRIQNGNVFVKPEGKDQFKISRKPSNHLLAMLRTVNDNDYVNPKLHTPQVGWPYSWADETDVLGNMPPAKYGLEPAWNMSDDCRSFHTDGSALEMRWLNYRHIVPGTEDWYYLSQNQMPPHGFTNNPQLITDFVAYNSGVVRHPGTSGTSDDAANLVFQRQALDGSSGKTKLVCNADSESIGFNWDGDLAMQCSLNVIEANRKFAMRLVKGGVAFLCTIDLATGMATLSIVEHENLFLPIESPTTINKPGVYKLRFANIDEQLRLWVDGTEISFAGNGEYDYLCEDPKSPLFRERSPTALDLTPASFGSFGAAVKLDHLKLFRDTYYIASDPSFRSGNCDMRRSKFYYFSTENAAQLNADTLSDPRVWEHFGKTRQVEFKMEKGQFFTMGDNSPKSEDARTWVSMPGGGQYVPREYMIGEAAAVYWPHGWPIPILERTNIPILNWSLCPNPKDMRLID